MLLLFIENCFLIPSLSFYQHLLTIAAGEKKAINKLKIPVNSICINNDLITAKICFTGIGRNFTPITPILKSVFYGL